MAHYVTQYAYDLLDHLVRADLPRPVPGGSYTQSRSWTYNAGDQRLGSQVQPETGSTSFVYNSQGLLQSKTDGKGIRKELTYDSKQRVTAMRYYSGSTEAMGSRVDSYYDNNPFDASFTQYGTGRLTAVAYQFQRYDASISGYWVVQVKEMYSYTPDGRLVKKRLQLQDGTAAAINLDASLSYDMWGRLQAITYPNGAGTYTYSYDTLSRLATLVNDGTTLVNNVTYGPADELLTIADLTLGGPTETRQYNVLGQLTSISMPLLVNLQYTYPAQNAGQISKMKDLLSGGQEVNYTYDSLGRLSTAATTSAAWGQSFVYDGWGNRTDQLVTKGSAPVISVSVDPATNRINSAGYLYDGAGNLTKMPKGAGYVYLTYDVENRVTVARSATWPDDGERYGYAPDNRRVYRNVIGTGERVMFWLGGQLLVELAPKMDGNGRWSGFWSTRTNKYFGGRRVGEVNDRLGSKVTSHKTYYPYGQETTVTADGDYKFGTYYRDSWTGLDYADQRYYASGLGRFVTADPYVASGGVANPGSWNRYSYVGGDPVTFRDTSGLFLSAIGGSEDIPAQQCLIGSSVFEGSFCDAYWTFWNSAQSAKKKQTPRKFQPPQFPYEPMSEEAEERQKSVAVALALKALVPGSDCWGLFNLTGSIKPDELLNGLLDKGKYGSIDFGYVKDDDTVAIEVPIDGRAIIRLNDNQHGAWNQGSDIDRALAVLHELGHAYATLYGTNSSKITPEGKPTDADYTKNSLANHDKVRNACEGAMK